MFLCEYVTNNNNLRMIFYYVRFQVLTTASMKFRIVCTSQKTILNLIFINLLTIPYRLLFVVTDMSVCNDSLLLAGDGLDHTDLKYRQACKLIFYIFLINFSYEIF
jgi:hypothetical protein